GTGARRGARQRSAVGAEGYPMPSIIDLIILRDEAAAAQRNADAAEARAVAAAHALAKLDEQRAEAVRKGNADDVKDIDARRNQVMRTLQTARREAALLRGS